MMPTVEFQPNVPVELALKCATGKPVKSQNPNNPRVMFTTVDDRALFLDGSVAAKIEGMNLHPGEVFRGCRAVNGRAVEWKFKRVGEQRDGTFAVPKISGAAPFPLESTAPMTSSQIQSSTQNPTMRSALPQRVLNPGGSTRADSPYQHSGTAAQIRETSNMLVDCMADSIEYAKKYGASVRPDDVRALVISVFIQQTKGYR